MDAREITKVEADGNAVNQTPKNTTRSPSKDSNPNEVHHVDDAAADTTMVELNDRYVKPGFFGMFQSGYVTYCALVVRLGGTLLSTLRPATEKKLTRQASSSATTRASSPSFSSCLNFSTASSAWTTPHRARASGRA